MAGDLEEAIVETRLADFVDQFGFRIAVLSVEGGEIENRWCAGLGHSGRRRFTSDVALSVCLYHTDAVAIQKTCQV